MRTALYIAVDCWCCYIERYSPLDLFESASGVIRSPQRYFSTRNVFLHQHNLFKTTLISAWKEIKHLQKKFISVRRAETSTVQLMRMTSCTKNGLVNAQNWPAKKAHAQWFRHLRNECSVIRLDFRRLPGPVFDPPSFGGWVRAHFPEQRLVIEPTLSWVRWKLVQTQLYN